LIRGGPIIQTRVITSRDKKNNKEKEKQRKEEEEEEEEEEAEEEEKEEKTEEPAMKAMGNLKRLIVRACGIIISVINELIRIDGTITWKVQSRTETR
jgi:uncharacterized membrane protein YdbT with pleckstrin-like domain